MQYKAQIMQYKAQIKSFRTIKIICYLAMRQLSTWKSAAGCAVFRRCSRRWTLCRRAAASSVWPPDRRASQSESRRRSRARRRSWLVTDAAVGFRSGPSSRWTSRSRNAHPRLAWPLGWRRSWSLRVSCLRSCRTAHGPSQTVSRALKNMLVNARVLRLLDRVENQSIIGRIGWGSSWEF